MSKIHINVKNQNNEKGQKNKENSKKVPKWQNKSEKIAWQPSGNQMATKWQPRLGKDR
jgi:hypothetical protein